MACGSCAERAQAAAAAQAAAQGVQGTASTSRPKYTVIAPDGSTESFVEYIDAVTHKRQVNGTLTTHM